MCQILFTGKSRTGNRYERAENSQDTDSYPLENHSPQTERESVLHVIIIMHIIYLALRFWILHTRIFARVISLMPHPFLRISCAPHVHLCFATLFSVCQIFNLPKRINFNLMCSPIVYHLPANERQNQCYSYGFNRIAVVVAVVQVRFPTIGIYILLGGVEVAAEWQTENGVWKRVCWLFCLWALILAIANLIRIYNFIHSSHSDTVNSTKCLRHCNGFFLL